MGTRVLQLLVDDYSAPSKPSGVLITSIAIIPRTVWEGYPLLCWNPDIVLAAAGPIPLLCDTRCCPVHSINNRIRSREHRLRLSATEWASWYQNLNRPAIIDITTSKQRIVLAQIGLIHHYISCGAVDVCSMSYVSILRIAATEDIDISEYGRSEHFAAGLSMVVSWAEGVSEILCEAINAVHIDDEGMVRVFRANKA